MLQNQTETENKGFLKTDKLITWCGSAGRHFHGLTIPLLQKKTFTHINTAVAIGRSLYACPPGVMITVSECEKVSCVR